MDGESRLFDLTRGGRFTLLSFGKVPVLGSDAPPIRILSVVAGPAPERVDAGEIVDSEGTLARAYGASDRTLALIRPDGYVGLISDSGDIRAVSDYLAPLA